MANSGSFKPGHKKLGGRGAGTPNKLTKDVRERLSDFIDAATPRMIQIAMDSDDVVFAKLYLEILEYILPKLQRTESKISIEEVRDRVADAFPEIVDPLYEKGESES